MLAMRWRHNAKARVSVEAPEAGLFGFEVDLGEVGGSLRHGLVVR